MKKTAVLATRGEAGLPRLALDEVTCSYGTFTAVDRLSLDIMPGEFISLLGPSGCGKTTTLRMIAGFVQPTAGTIAMDGEIISAPGSTLAPEKRQMSMIFQSYAVWPNMTVAENVAFGLHLRPFDRATIAHKVQEVLETVRLAPLAGRYPAELSGGQQQRVALARAIVIQPRVLLLDEPLSNLDANLREEMRYEIRRLHNAYKFTTVYVTHDQAEAMVTSDRIAVMNQGRLEQIDAPYALYTRPRTRFVAGFIGRTNFLDGVCAGDLIDFDRFAFPRACLGDGLAREGRLIFSVRPQSLKLHRASPTGGSPLVVESRLVERAFLGETWEYIVAPGGGDLQLRATTPPNQVFEAGEVVWLEFDPAQMVAVA